MFKIEDCIIMTNNTLVVDKYSSLMKIKYVKSYKDVLIQARDYIYNKHKLLTHPQAGSLKPNQTPYRSVILYPTSDNKENVDSVMLIEKAIDTFNKFNEIRLTPEYPENIQNDYKKIDLSIIDNVISRIV